MPNAEWGTRYDDGGAAVCTVLGFAAGAADDGSDGYVVETEGNKYLFLATVTDQQVKLEDLAGKLSQPNGRLLRRPVP